MLGARADLPACLTLTGLALALAACAATPMPIDEDPASGFAIYRSGQLDRGELAALCRLGVEEMLVLNGNAVSRECRFRSEVCPDLRVRYDRTQDAFLPVDATFLARFDAWVEEARREGRKIAFRCRHGWHRAGRLSAWYRMRFQQASAADAIDEMLRLGRFMERHPQLPPQVEAMADHLHDRPCSTAPEHCVRPQRAATTAEFRHDICP